MAAADGGVLRETGDEEHFQPASDGAAGIGHLVLTHLIPPPLDPAAEKEFEDDVRAGGYAGRVTVGYDLFTLELA